MKYFVEIFRLWIPVGVSQDLPLILGVGSGNSGVEGGEGGTCIFNRAPEECGTSSRLEIMKRTLGIFTFSCIQG